MNQILHSQKSLVPFGTTPLLTQPDTRKLTPTSPAVYALTDFTQVKAQSVNDDTSIDEANLKMRYSGVRLLFVIDAHSHCIGVLTSREVIGTRRINLAMQQRNLDREEVTAGMIMTPWEKLSAMPIEQLKSLSIEDLVLSMESFSEQHLLITERTPEGELTVRGLISATDIQTAMGERVKDKMASPVVPMASNFADICKVVTGHDL